MSKALSAASIDARRRELLESLAPVGALRRDDFALPGVGTPMSVLRPADFDRLLDFAVADPEQNLPYWAEVWPSGVALAACVAQDRGEVAGKRVLELGCGLGVTAIAALAAGAELLVTDYAPEALTLCALNALEAVGREAEALQLNWRDAESVSRLDVPGPFSLVLAADILYEMRDVEPLLRAVERLVAPAGALWLAEPRRVPATLFVETLAVRGWRNMTNSCEGPWPDPEDNRKGVVVNVHRLQRFRVGE